MTSAEPSFKLLTQQGRDKVDHILVSRVQTKGTEQKGPSKEEQGEGVKQRAAKHKGGQAQGGPNREAQAQEAPEEEGRARPARQAELS